MAKVVYCRHFSSLHHLIAFFLLFFFYLRFSIAREVTRQDRLYSSLSCLLFKHTWHKQCKLTSSYSIFACGCFCPFHHFFFFFALARLEGESEINVKTWWKLLSCILTSFSLKSILCLIRKTNSTCIGYSWLPIFYLSRRCSKKTRSCLEEHRVLLLYVIYHNSILYLKWKMSSRELLYQNFDWVR